MVDGVDDHLTEQQKVVKHNHTLTTFMRLVASFYQVQG